MSNNKERMEPTDTVHLFLALRRNKDNRDIEDHQELCFHQVVRDYDKDLAILKTRIASFPGTWRIHKTVNKRNIHRARIWMMKRLIDTDGSYDYRIDTLWKKALMNNPIKEKFLIDIDTTNEDVLNNITDKLVVNDIEFYSVTNTPNGYHIVCDHFDTRLIADIENVSFKRDGYVFVEKVIIPE